MTKSNLYKYINTLCQSGMLNRDPYTNAFTLGHKLLELGSIAMGNTTVVEQAMPYFKEIAEKTNLTALLSIPSLKGSLIAYIHSADYGINIGAQIGANLPLDSATGLLFSTFENRAHLKKWEQDFAQNWSKDERKQFQLEQELTRKTFFASKMEPLVEHVSSFSVPILNFNEDLLAVITIVGFTDLVPKNVVLPTSKLVLQYAHSLSEYYGYVQKN